MFQNDLQRRIHNGEREAFKELYNRYSTEVYSLTQTALGDSEKAKDALKQVFMKLYRELMRTENDLDLAERLSALTNEEIRLARILAGEISKDALQVQYTVSVDLDSNSNDTMTRVRSRVMPSEPAADSFTVREETPRQVVPVDPFFADERPEPQSKPDYVEEDRSYSRPVPPKEDIDTNQRRKTEDLGLQPKKKKKSGSGFVVFLLVLLVIVFVWILLGILMDLGYIPFKDLGYRLFNQRVFNFFKIPS